MPNTKEQLLERIKKLKEREAASLTRGSGFLELQNRYLVMDVLEYLLISDTAQKLD